MPNPFNSTQEFARRDGRVQVVNLSPSFQPDHNKPINGNPYKHLDSMANDFAGPTPGMYNIKELGRLIVSNNQVLDKAWSN